MNKLTKIIRQAEYEVDDAAAKIWAKHESDLLKAAQGLLRDGEVCYFANGTCLVLSKNNTRTKRTDALSDLMCEVWRTGMSLPYIFTNNEIIQQ
jgi:hypothetical protein